MGDYFAIEADTMIDIVKVTWIEIVFELLYLIGTFIKLCHLNESYYFSIYMSIYFNVIGIRKYVIKRLYITSATQFNGLVISNDYND